MALVFGLRTTKLSIIRRGDFGQSTVEVVCGLVIFVPLILLVIDGITIYGGYSANIKLCADAARAAASGPPNAISPGTPKKRAEATIRNEYGSASSEKVGQFGILHVHPDCVATEQMTGAPPDPKIGGPIDGQVTIQTTVDVVPPFLIKQFAKSGITLTTSQTYPYTYNLPASAN
jgi:hypothetical protein